MSEHRVATHLGVEASTYDAAIRRFIPHYEEMIAAVIAELAALDRHIDVVDLGTGTGALAGAILDAIPRARVTLVDIDPAMLEVARSRVAAHGDRARVVRASFLDELPACDAVVASLALHHIPERADKTKLYANVREALRPGGRVLSADCAIHEGGVERTNAMRVWARWMGDHGIAADEAEALFVKWGGEDRYYPLVDELAMLGDAGFAQPEVYWRRGPMAVFGASR